MWIAASGGVLKSLGAAGGAKKKDARDFKNEQRLNEQKGVISRQNSQFDAEQDYYYKQLQRQEAMRGLDEFRKFSTVSQFAPQYQNTNPNPVLPAERPVFNAGSYVASKPVK